MTIDGRAPAYQSREDFDRIFRLHVAQPWTARKHDELYYLLGECETLEQQHLVIEMLHGYENFDEERTHATFSAIRNTVVNDWGCTGNDTIFVAVHDSTSTSPSSAQAIMQMMKNAFSGHGWSKASFFTTLTSSIAAVNSNTNIVFIDDFVGTGQQFCGRFDWYREELKKLGFYPNFFITALCIMHQAVGNLDARKIRHFAGTYMKKAISDTYDGIARDERLSQMNQIEMKLRWRNGKQHARYSLGFSQSEALFRHMENNCPNNNFPIFWWKESSKHGRRSTMQSRL